MNSIEHVLSGLQRLNKTVKQTGDSQWQAQCPAHDDEHPSLTITEASDGTVLLKCHANAGCSTNDVCKALGLELKDLFPNKVGREKGVGRNIAATHNYEDEDGRLSYQVVRVEPKSFFVRRPNAKDGWIKNLTGVKRVPYNLPEVLAATKDDWVFFVEGEKDADRLMDYNLISSTSVFGAGNWRPEYARYFKNKQVAIIPDNDVAGQNHSYAVAAALDSVCNRVCVIDLPDLPPKGDVSNWMDNGGSKELLLDLANKAEPFERVDGRSDSPQKFNHTDVGNAERFVAKCGHELKYSWDWEKWLYYDGRRWNLAEGESMILPKAIETIRSIIDECIDASNGEREALLRWSSASEKKSRLYAMTDIARYLAPIKSFSSEFNKNLFLLNCLNGTIDLKTGELHPHNPDNMITKLCPVEYDPDANLDIWYEFLDTATKGDKEVQKFLQKSVGYTSTGDVSEEKLFFVHGATASGKSTFLETVKAMLGDYSKTADFDTFLQRKSSGSPRNDIAALVGARFVVSIEADEGKKWAEGLMKSVTGGDTITARFLHKEFFEFIPQFKLWFAANHAPYIRDDDGAAWRRILRVPFDHTIPKEQRDPSIKKKLKDPENGGRTILKWAVEGCLLWLKEGLQVPKAIEDATEEYRRDMDPLMEFLELECIFRKDAEVGVTELRKAYDKYAEENGIRYPLGSKRFNERIRTEGCEYKTVKRGGKCLRVWIGIELTPYCYEDDSE